jgi:hypothetical protein
VDVLLCSAARRLAILVACEVALVLLAVVRDARVGGLVAVSGGVGLALFALALFPLTYATHIVRAAERARDGPAAARVYRTSAREADRDPEERAAVRHAAVALMLLASAGALTVVAAASR